MIEKQQYRSRCTILLVLLVSSAVQYKHYSQTSVSSNIVYVSKPLDGKG